MRVLVGLVASLSAACAYRPDSFSAAHGTFGRTSSTIGCLDVGLQRQPAKYALDVVVAYDFGNRCDTPTMVDLAAVKVFGTTEPDHMIQLLAYDPRDEIRPALLDGNAVGREVIAYRADVAISTVCVDVAAIAHKGSSRLLCLD
jgi:hypothetical protein